MGEHTNEHTYVLTYIRTGQTLYPLHNFVVRGDNNSFDICKPQLKILACTVPVKTVTEI